MADETIEVDSATPGFALPDFSRNNNPSVPTEEDVRNAQKFAEQIVQDGKRPEATVPPRRRRRFADSSASSSHQPQPSRTQQVLSSPRIPHVPARDRKQVVIRLEKMMTGATGIVAVVRPYFQMTDSEANDIAEPLTDWLLRQEEFTPQIREFLDRYDLIAATFAVLAYLVRVWNDDTSYREQQRSERAARERAIANERNAERTQFPRASGGQEGENLSQHSARNGGVRPSVGIPPGQL